VNKGRPLAEAYPEVAATWHPERNGKLTPDQVPSKVAREVWWRCPAGHEWQERIATRTTLPKWKHGDVAACRHCSGDELVLTEYTYPECGHTRRLTKANRDKKPARCWDCIVEWRETIGKAELANAAKASAPKAADLIAAVPVQEGTPEPLVREWRWWAAMHLQGAFGREAVGMDGAAVDEVLAMVTEQAAHLRPTKADASRAAADTGVLRILDHAHWAAGWLHHLPGRRPRPVGDDELAAVARLFADWFGEWASYMIGKGIAEQLSTAQMTKLITHQAGDLARSLSLPGLPQLPVRAYKEVRLPVIPPGAVRYGRLDTLIWHPLRGEIVVEIDSGFPASLRSSAMKLAFARDVGAVPVWIRLDHANVTVPDGVAVIRPARRGTARRSAGYPAAGSSTAPQSAKPPRPYSSTAGRGSVPRSSRTVCSRRCRRRA